MFTDEMGFLVCLLFILTLLGNSIVIATVKQEPSLQQPMYFFLCMLAMNNMCLSSSAALKMIGIFWFDVHSINFDACLTQMHFIHTLCIMESAILVAMAFKRFVAICIPLHYVSILTTSVVTKLGLIRGVLLILSYPFLIKRLPYHTKYIIPHAYIEHMAVVRLASANTLMNRIYGISVALSVIIVDVGQIGTSFVNILQSVFQIFCQNAYSKDLGTCVVHVCTIFVSYTRALFRFPTHHIGKNVPPCVHSSVSSLYLLVPSAVNPVVYGVRTKQICDRVINRSFLFTEETL